MAVIKQHLNNIKLAHKFALLSTTALLLISFAGMFLVWHISKLYHQQLYEKTSVAMTYLVSDLENRLREIATATDYLVDDDQIQAALTIYDKSENTEERARNKRSIYDKLYSYYNSSPYIVSIVLLLPDGSFVRMGYSEQDFTNDAFLTLEKEAESAGGRLIWKSGSCFQNAVICARQIRQKEYLKLNKLATLFIEIDMEKLVIKSMSQADKDFRNTRLILETSEGTFYYPYPFPLSTDSLAANTIKDYEILELDKNKWFITAGSLPYTQWKYLNFSDYDDLFSKINQAVIMAIMILIVTTVIVILLQNMIISHIIFHFRLLEQKMKHFESGCPEPLSVGYDYSGRNDEIGIMHRRFDQTVLNYKKLVHDNYRVQLLLKDAAIRNLEQQINPHFLYNVLDSIYLMAEAHGVPDIADMSHALAGLFRASISENNTIISLSRELDYLNSYIQIQSIRFKDQIHFTASCDPECMDIPIPKLSIQPLVENAIKHGIEETGEPCRIILDIHMENDGTHISISNTGSYFEPDMSYKITYPDSQEQNMLPEHGIGLKNINERLQLIYGGRCQLCFANQDQYAVVSFTIPKGGPENV